MTTAWGKKIFYECVACVCLTFPTISLMGVLTISLALPIDLYNSLWNSENG